MSLLSALITPIQIPLVPTFAWWDPSDATTLTVASNLCSQMNDRSGNGHTLTASGSNRPSSGTDTINGLNALGFASAAVMATASLTQAQPLTILAVVKLTTTTSTAYRVAVSDSAGAQVFLGTPGFGSAPQNQEWESYAGTEIQAGTTDTAAHVLGCVLNGASSKLILDGTTLSSGNPGSNGFSSTTLCFGGIANGTLPLKGDQGETLIYTSALSATDYAAATAYLKAKWATT